MRFPQYILTALAAAVSFAASAGDASPAGTAPLGNGWTPDPDGYADPQGYLLAAERLGVPAEDCYIFEDSLNGLRAARAAGGTVVGITTTNPESAVAPLADIVLGNAAELNV